MMCNDGKYIEAWEAHLREIGDTIQNVLLMRGVEGVLKEFETWMLDCEYLEDH